jgi:taurine dioxygenase
MTIQFAPLHPLLGAEVRGLDLHQPMSDALAQTLRQGLRKHRLLLVRGQPGLSVQQQVEFTKCFGELYVSRSYKGEMGEQGYYFSNTRTDGQLGTGELSYHHDHLFNERPCSAAVLYAIEVPPSGSATKFRDSIEMYNRLPDSTKAQAEAVRCLHVLDYASVSRTGRVQKSDLSPKALRAWQPLVWSDPQTRALWLVPLTTHALDGIDEAAGMALLDTLWAEAETMHDLEYVHQWHTGDILIWDNLRLSHARLPFNDAEPRTLRRTTVR